MVLGALALGSVVLVGCVRPAPPPPPPSGHLTASPTSIDFGSVASGAGAGAPITITSDGPAGGIVPVFSIGSASAGVFYLSNVSCFSALAPGQSCQLSVGVPVIGGPPPGSYSAVVTINKPPGDQNPQSAITVPVSITVT